MIRYVTPYSTSGNLAEAMNFEISISPKGSYVAFVDRDTIWLDPKFGHKISEIVDKHGEAFYTCLTNRTNCEWQKAKKAIFTTGPFGGGDYCENDISNHVHYALLNWEAKKKNIKDHTNSQLWSGHLMLCPVDLWTPLTTKGLLGVDNEIHRHARDNGHRVLLMTGVYIYHYYSNFDGVGGHQKRDKTHLL